MGKGFGKGMPQGFNMNNLVKQAQKMQQQMEKAQQEIEEKTFEVTSGGGAIKIVISGKKELKSININPEVVDSDDIEMLEDLILAAVNEAIRQSDEYATKEMSKITGGAGLPGGMF